MKSQMDDKSCLIVIRKVKRTMVQSICKFLPCPQITYRGAVWTTYELLLLLTIFIYPCAAQSWEKSGCHLVGYKQKVHISGCVIFEIETNACRGYCVSEATPSDYFTRRANSNHIITSRAECCSIKDTVDIKVSVKCLEGFRVVKIKSAKSCSCSVCRK